MLSMYAIVTIERRERAQSSATLHTLARSSWPKGHKSISAGEGGKSSKTLHTQPPSAGAHVRTTLRASLGAGAKRTAARPGANPNDDWRPTQNSNPSSISAKPPPEPAHSGSALIAYWRRADPAGDVTRRLHEATRPRNARRRGCGQLRAGMSRRSGLGESPNRIG